MADTKMLCKKCKAELVRDKKRGCYYCIVCNPTPNPVVVKEEPIDKRIDVQMTREEVEVLIRKIVPNMIRDELENWHIQKPPVTKTETDMAAQLIIDGKEVATTILNTENLNGSSVTVIPKQDWRKEARELGVNQKHKTKEMILKEIEAIKAGTSGLNVTSGETG